MAATATAAACALGLAACATYQTKEAIYCDQYPNRCVATYHPRPIPGPPPGQPAPDLNVRKITCDVDFAGTKITARVQNAGNLDARGITVPVPPSNTPMLSTFAVSAVVDLIGGGTETSETTHYGAFAQGADVGVLVRLSHSWSDVANISVSAEMTVIWQESNYSNNVLTATVSQTPNSDNEWCHAER